MSADALSGCRAVVFDAYGTLFNIHAATAREAAALGEQADAVSNLWRQKQLEYTWLRSLMPAHADFWQVTQDGLDFALETFGIEDPALRQRLLDLYWTLDAYPDAQRTLEALKAGGRHKTAILTNGSRDMIDAACEASGLAPVLDAILSVDTVGVYKPDPRIYELVGLEFETKPHEVCFVSTNSWDARAAAYFGFRVVWLDRFGKVPDKLPGDFTMVLTDLSSLPQHLGL